MKRCPHCDRTLPDEEFYWKDRAHTVRSSWCRSCQIEMHKKIIKKPVDKEKQKQYDRRHKLTSAAREVATILSGQAEKTDCEALTPEFMAGILGISD